MLDTLNNWSIGVRLLVMIAISSVALLLVGGIGLWGTQRNNTALQEILSRHLTAISGLQQVRAKQLTMANHIFEARLAQDAFVAQEKFDQVDKLIAEVDRLLQTHQAHAMGTQEKTLFEQYLEARKAYGVQGINPIRDLLSAEDFAGANAHYNNVMAPLFQKVLAATDAVIDHLNAEAANQGEEVSGLSRALQSITILAMLAGLVLTLSLGLLIRLSIVRRVHQLETTTGMIVQGRLANRANLSGRDEITAIGAAFDRISTEFARVVGEIRDGAHQVERAAHDTAQNSSAVARASTVQESMAQEAAQAADRLNQAVDEVGRNIEVMVRSANEAQDLAQGGQKVIGEAAREIDAISTTVTQSTQAMTTLSGHTQEIGRIADVIRDIAEQTNLLALNAAIEAARAGEQGRGFAVVADEVRKLAERTAKATNEVASTIQTIQEETGRAVESMESANHRVASGVQKARDSDAAVHRVNQAVAALTALINEIGDICNRQDAASKEISLRVGNILSMASENRRASENSCDAARDLTVISSRQTESVSRFQL